MRGLDFDTVALLLGGVLLSLAIYTTVAALVSFAYALRHRSRSIRHWPMAPAR